MSKSSLLSTGYVSQVPLDDGTEKEVKDRALIKTKSVQTGIKIHVTRLASSKESVVLEIEYERSTLLSLIRYINDGMEIQLPSTETTTAKAVKEFPLAETGFMEVGHLGNQTLFAKLEK